MHILDFLRTPAEIMSLVCLAVGQASSAFCLISSGYPKRAESRLGNLDTHPCVSPDNFAVEVTNRAWIRAAVVPFAQRKFSILLDTRTLEEQYQSRFRCLRRDSRFSVHSQFL